MSLMSLVVDIIVIVAFVAFELCVLLLVHQGRRSRGFPRRHITHHMALALVTLGGRARCTRRCSIHLGSSDNVGRRSPLHTISLGFLFCGGDHIITGSRSRLDKWRPHVSFCTFDLRRRRTHSLTRLTALYTWMDTPYRNNNNNNSFDDCDSDKNARFAIRAELNAQENGWCFLSRRWQQRRRETLYYRDP